MKKLFAAAVGLLVVGSVWGAVTIENVTLRQRWPWGREVDITYTLKGVTDPVAVKPTFTVGGQTLDVPESALGGERAGLASGFHRLVWDPGVSASGDVKKLEDVKVSLAVTTMPLYAIYDLDKGPDAIGQPEYVFEDDLRAGKWGDWQENPYDYIDSVVWTGVTKDSKYKTDKLVLRYVYPTTDARWIAHAGSDTYLMGAPSGTPDGNGGTSNESYVMNSRWCSPQQTVRLTKGFWLGVFEVTQHQFYKVTGSWWSSFFRNASYCAARPVECIDVGVARGWGWEGYEWPAKGHLVKPDSFMDKLRKKTGAAFDLPLESQWEYACRAGSTGLRYGAMKSICRCWYQNWSYGQDDGTSGGTAAVGTYAPNAWGFYDMLGNVNEYCLDIWATYSSAQADVSGTDPVGPKLAPGATEMHVLRGGEYYDYIGYSTAPYRDGKGGTSSRMQAYSIYGMRVCLPID